MVHRLLAGQSWIRTSASTRDFSDLQNVQWVTSSFLRVKHLGQDTDHLSKVEVTNKWAAFLFPYMPLWHGQGLLHSYLFQHSWCHYQSNTTLELRRRSESFKCKSSEMWHCLIGRVVQRSERSSCLRFQDEAVQEHDGEFDLLKHCGLGIHRIDVISQGIKIQMRDNK